MSTSNEIKSTCDHIFLLLKGSGLQEEVSEFLETIKDKAEDMQNEITDLQEKVDELNTKEEDIDDEPYDEVHDLGLDTISYRLNNGNLLIKEKVYQFIESLKLSK